MRLSVVQADRQYSAPLSLSESWKIMEELKKEGLTRSIGVSNYREEDLLEMEPHWEIPPAVNQASPLASLSPI
jgi:diketogulonate reductase-like aldo/keto reductase